MKQKERTHTLTEASLKGFLSHLQQEEKSQGTIQMYRCALGALLAYLSGQPMTKNLLIQWKQDLASRYAAASVNAKLAAVNGFLDFRGWGDLRVKPLKVQRSLFCSSDKEMTRKEYLRLVQAAKARGNDRLSLVLQTICATGIRVSELEFITLEAVRSGHTQVNCKGKVRTVFLPGKLRKPLLEYAKKQNRYAGPVFPTRNGKPLNRSNIWRDMKALCESANVDPRKVFPHNLRHLFARIYYSVEKDLSRLADLLGHTNISTTRIYTMESGEVHAKQLDRMSLVVT